MEAKEDISAGYREQVEKFLNEFMFNMYRGHDHVVARKYFHDLFNELIPKYFCICDGDKNKSESRINQ